MYSMKQHDDGSYSLFRNRRLVKYPPSPAEIEFFHTAKQMKQERDYLEDLLSRLMTEVRPYCRPACVNYDVFPVFKEATNFIKGDSHEDN